MTNNMPEMTNNMPDTSDAEEWVTADIFRYKDKLYQIDLWGNITEYSDVWGTITEYADWECPKCHKKGGMKYPSNIGGKSHCKYCGKYSWMIDPDKRKDR